MECWLKEPPPTPRPRRQPRDSPGWPAAADKLLVVVVELPLIEIGIQKELESKRPKCTGAH